MNSFPGEEDRGANDHYALRGRIAWQPTEDTDVDLILRYLRADKERQAGLYSHEPACPNAQRQGEFTPPTEACAFWGSPEGAAGTGFRNDAIIPSRGGDPWATEETSLSYVDRTIRAATLRIDSRIGELDFVSITDYQNADKFYIEGGDASPVEGVVFYQGSDIEQYSEELRLSGDFGSQPPRRRPVLHERRRRLHRPVRRSVLRGLLRASRLRLHSGHHGVAGNDLVRRLPAERMEGDGQAEPHCRPALLAR